MDEIAISKYLGLAIRAGSVIYGLDNIKKYTRHIHVIICCHTASNNLKKSLSHIMEKSHIQIINLHHNTLDDLIHTTNCKTIGITNPQLAEQIKLLK